MDSKGRDKTSAFTPKKKTDVTIRNILFVKPSLH